MQGEGLHEQARPETWRSPGRGSSSALGLLEAWKLPLGREAAPIHVSVHSSDHDPGLAGIGAWIKGGGGTEGKPGGEVRANWEGETWGVLEPWTHPSAGADPSPESLRAADALRAPSLSPQAPGPQEPTPTRPARRLVPAQGHR